MKVNLETREVMIWDAARKSSYQIVKHWIWHVVNAIGRHRPHEVQKDGLNVVFDGKGTKNKDKPKDGMPLWKCKGFEKGYYQTDNYSCGPIAINRFAEILKSLSGDKVLGNRIDGFMTSADELKEYNYANAKSLFECLLETKEDFWKKEGEEKREENHTKNDMAGCDKATDTQPAMGTPKHDRDESTKDLVDTPEDAGPKRPKKLGKQRADIVVGRDDCVGRDDGGGEEKWTQEEEREYEFGHQRFLFKACGVQKKNFTSLKRVQDKHPRLRDVMEYLQPGGGRGKKKQVTAWLVADAILSVPLWGEGELLNKNKNREWLRDDVFCPPRKIPKDCQYTVLESEGPTLNAPMRNRSRRLYEARKKEEINPVEVLRCPVHKEKGRTVLQMSK
jgi:hypothetical protein